MTELVATSRPCPLANNNESVVRRQDKSKRPEGDIELAESMYVYVLSHEYTVQSMAMLAHIA